MPLSSTGTIVVTSEMGSVGTVHDANFRERVWEKMMRWDEFGGDGIYIEIVRSVGPHLEQIQIECVSEQHVNGGGCE